MRRRDFLGRAAALVGAAAVGRSTFDPRGLAAMTSTGSRAFAEYGVQLYTVRSLMSESVPDTLAAVAGIGYRQVELAGLFGMEPAAFRALLDANGLTAPATHLGIEALQGDQLEGTLAAAHTLGHRWIIVPSLPRDLSSSPAGISSVARTLTRAGRAAAQHGMGVGFHNHAGEWQAFDDGSIPMDILLAETDESVVSFEMDIFWTVHAGVDPLARLRRDPGRYSCVHVKDRTADGNMVPVGAGVIDFATILPEAERLGVTYAFVEHDRPENPREDIASSYRHLREILG